MVVDARYDSEKYGQNQEKAPLNIHKPWIFEGEEHYRRRCHTVAYYKKLFKLAGFKIVKEFDIEGGKAFAYTNPNKIHGPSYRRY